MTLTKVLFGIGIVAGLLMFNRTKPILLKIVLVALALSMALAFFEDYININIPYFGFGFLTLGFTVWCGIEGKWTSLVIGLFAFLSFLWSYLNWSLIGELRFLMIAPIIIYIWTLIKKRESENALSILTLLVFFELSDFLILMRQWIKLI